MKKVFIMLIAVIFVVGLASVTYAAIAQTKHNLTTSNITGSTHTTDATATLCGFCHIPHGGNTTITGAPLWARKTPAGPYTLYSSGGAGKTLANTTIVQPGTMSLTCLSCHDGTIGVGTVTKNGVDITYVMTGTYVNASGQLITVAGQAYQPNLTTNLQNDHPVGFTFPAGGYGTNGGIPGIGLTVIGTTTATAHLTGATSGKSYPLFQETAPSPDAFECATCHDPHLQDSAGQTKFLRAPNATLCQDCHNLK